MTQTSEAAEALRKGGLVVLPTDTVYGIGANPFDEAAVRRLLSVKGRTETKPPPVLGQNAEDLFELVAFTSKDQEALADALADSFWPGPLTLILPAKVEMGWDTGPVGDTVALRAPNHPLALELLKQTGPLAVTSANPSDLEPARTAAQAQEYFGSAVEHYLDGGTLKTGTVDGGAPSTILDLTKTPPKFLRRGDIDALVLSQLGLPLDE